MISRIRNFFSPPFVSDHRSSRLGGLLNNIILTSLFSATIYALYLLFTNPAPLTGLAYVGGLSVIFLISYYLMHNGQITSSAILLTLALWFVIAFAAYQFGGVSNPVYYGLLLIILIAGILLGTTAAIL